MKKKWFLYLIMGFLLISLSGCEEIFEKDESNPEDQVSDEPDAEGNLLIINQADTRLALFRGEEKIKIIPNSIEDFLVNVPNPDGNTVDLKIFKITDGSIEEEVFKRWAVPLAADNEKEHRSTWILNANSAEKASGTITMSYSGGTENFVEVYLNYHNGPKLATLFPGTNFRKQVGIDYGNYTLHYRYFYSDPNTPESVETLGWIDKSLISGNEENIWVVLNQYTTVKDIFVPHWQGNGTAEEMWGTLKVINNKSHPVIIKANGNLIERIMFEEEDPIQNASTIPSNSIQEFVIPVEQYNFKAIHPDGTEVISSINDSIVSDETIQWTVE